MALPQRLFCDTSFFYACLDPRDENYRRARELMREAAVLRCLLLTTWDIVGETLTLVRYRRGFRTAIVFLDEIKPHLRIVRYGDRVRSEAEGIFREYARDHRLSFCDAVSFIVVTALLGDMACLAFDRDFRALGLTVIV